MHPEESQADGITSQEQEPAAGRPRRRVAVLVAAIVAAALLAAVGVTYLVGGFADKGRFGAEPPACTAIEPSLHLLGTAYTTRLTDSNGCDLLLPGDHPRYSATPKISINYAALTPDKGDAPEAASQAIRPLVEGRSLAPLPGVGDEAYLWGSGVVMRVSNLVVAIVVYPRQESTEDQVRAFAADLARRLRAG